MPQRRIDGLAILGLVALVCACSHGRAPTAAPDRPPGARYEAIVLGVAQDGGLPHFGCTKPCCEDARRDGRELFPASLALHDRETGALALIEATPAVERQVALLHEWTGARPRERRPVDALLLTHAHIGHYAGLIHFGREVAATDAIPLFVTTRMSEYLSAHGPWSQLVALRQIVPTAVRAGEPFRLGPGFEGLEITALAVEHRQEYADTVAFRIRGPNRTVLFLPDIDRWADGEPASLLDGVDVAWLDATFYDGSELPGRDLSQIPHPRMVETMERLGAAARESPGRIRFIHLNHTNPALHDAAIVERIEAAGFRIARRGERVGL